MILLDTHVWLWMTVDPDQFSEDVRATLADPHQSLALSAASSWEISIKFALGRLPLPDIPSRYIPEQMRLQGVTGLVVEHAHALHVASLPPLHSDPFDRILVAQAQLLSVPILTVDEAIARYDVEIIRAR